LSRLLCVCEKRPLLVLLLLVPLLPKVRLLLHPQLPCLCPQRRMLLLLLLCYIAERCC
jgi:hypothetical protein